MGNGNCLRAVNHKTVEVCTGIGEFSYKKSVCIYAYIYIYN